MAYQNLGSGSAHRTAELWDDDDIEAGTLGGSKVIYRASFAERRDGFIRYKVFTIVLYVFSICLLCFLSGVLPGTLPAMFSGDGGSEDNAKTIGLVVIMVCAGVMALGLAFVAPCARRMAAMEIDSLSLHIDSQNLVIRRGKPMCCPVRSFMSYSEKSINLALITDVVIGQGCIQARYGISSVKIENAGQGGSPKGGFDMVVMGLADPKAFKRLLLAIASRARAGNPVTEDEVAMFQKSGGSYGFAAAGSSGAPAVNSLVGGAPIAFATADAFADEQANARADALEAKFDRMNSTLERIVDILSANAAAAAAATGSASASQA